VVLGGVSYQLTLLFRDVPDGGWYMDIADGSGNPILQGVPLVPGADLLAQYEYLDFGGQLGMYNGQAPFDAPSYANLGIDSQLYWITP
jgi:hypothetical protein